MIFIMRFFLSFSLSVLLLIVFSAFLPVNGEEAVYENTMRLHVIANSDSKEDQALKLSVRDAVLAEAEIGRASCRERV